MAKSSTPSEREQFWQRHLRACADGSLKAYAAKHGLNVSSLYAARARRKRPPEPATARFVRVQGDAAPAPAAPLRVSFRNGTVLELACTAEHWPALLASLAALP